MPEPAPTSPNAAKPQPQGPSPGTWVLPVVGVVAIALLIVVTAAIAVPRLLGLRLSAFLGSRRDPRSVEVIAHRAGAKYAPENTLAAVRIAKAMGADRLELDVRRTRDGQLVVIHDPDLSRVAGVNVRVADVTLAELKRYDVGALFSKRFAGERIPTLAEYVSVASTTPLAVEVKEASPGDESITRQTVAELQQLGASQRSVMISLDYNLAPVARSVDPSIAVGDFVTSLVGTPWMLPINVVAPAEGVAPAWFMTLAHARDKFVWVWTLDDAALIEQAVGRGADGVITNDVVGAREALQRIGR